MGETENDRGARKTPASVQKTAGTPRRSPPAPEKSPQKIPRPDKELREIPSVEALIAGHCRNAATELPRGVLGVATAEEFLAAIPEACRRRLPDITGSGPKLFSVLVEHGLLAAMPSPRVVPAALNLIAGVSPLLEPRSARLWTLWLTRVHDPSSALFAALRERTPASQFGVQEIPGEVRPLRAAALRAERDRLLAKNAELRASAERDQHELAAHRAANEELRAKLDALAAEAAGYRAKIHAHEQAREAPPTAQEQLTAQIEAARRALRASDDDTRDLVTLAAEVARAKRSLEMKNDGLKQRVADLENFCDELERNGARTKPDTSKARAEKAERELAKAQDARETAQAGVKVLAEKLERRKFQLHSLQKHIESMEIELAQADAELKMRRTRMFSPTQAEVDAVRQAEAARLRKLQEKRRPLTDDDSREQA